VVSVWLLVHGHLTSGPLPIVWQQTLRDRPMNLWRIASPCLSYFPCRCLPEFSAVFDCVPEDACAHFCSILCTYRNDVDCLGKLDEGLANHPVGHLRRLNDRVEEPQSIVEPSKLS